MNARIEDVQQGDRRGTIPVMDGEPVTLMVRTRVATTAPARAYMGMVFVRGDAMAPLGEYRMELN